MAEKGEGTLGTGLCSATEFPYLVIKVGVTQLLFDIEEGILQIWP